MLGHTGLLGGPRGQPKMSDYRGKPWKQRAGRMVARFVWRCINVGGGQLHEVTWCVILQSGSSRDGGGISQSECDMEELEKVSRDV